MLSWPLCRSWFESHSIVSCTYVLRGVIVVGMVSLLAGIYVCCFILEKQGAIKKDDMQRARYELLDIQLDSEKNRYIEKEFVRSKRDVSRLMVQEGLAKLGSMLVELKKRSYLLLDAVEIKKLEDLHTAHVVSFTNLSDEVVSAGSSENYIADSHVQAELDALEASYVQGVAGGNSAKALVLVQKMRDYWLNYWQTGDKVSLQMLDENFATLKQFGNGGGLARFMSVYEGGHANGKVIHRKSILLSRAHADFVDVLKLSTEKANVIYTQYSVQLTDAKNTKMYVLMVSVAAVMLLLSWLNTQVMRGVVTPLRRLGISIRKLDKDYKSVIPYTDRQSEIGEIARALQELRSALAQLDEYDQRTISQERELSQKQGAEHAKVVAEESNEAKSKFLATMAHELRTPISSLMLLSEELLDNPTDNLNDRQLRSLSFVMKSGKELLMIVNDVLDLAKVEAGELKIVQNQLNIKEFSSALLYRYRAMATSKGLGYFVDVDDDLPSTMWTDELRLEQVVRNFITNAMKFTESGEVRISISRPAPRNLELYNENLESNGSILISVQDTGVGIAEDELQDVFDEFKQVGSSARNAQPGTGLGLSISQKLAKMLGGGIHVTSEVGRGSCFSICVPLHLEMSDGSNEKNIVIEESVADDVKEDRFTVEDLEGKNVLVVDDDERNMFALTHLLTRSGVVCTPASNGQQAVAIMEDNIGLFDMVLLDIMMPVMNGYEVLAYMQESEILRKIPVIVVTAKAFDFDMNECVELGACDYIAKPIVSRKLFDSMVGVLNMAA